MSKPTTMRLSEEQMEELRFVSSILDISISDIMREALVDYLHKTQADVQFRIRLKKRIEHDQTILKRLQ